MDFIDQLRQKPAGTKKRIAFVTSAVVTLAIFGVWASVLHFGLNKKLADATATVANSSENDVNPFAAFWSVISKGWDGLANNISQIKTSVSSSSQPILTPAQEAAPQKDVLILGDTTQ